MFKEKAWPSAYLIKFSYLYILMIPIYIKVHITLKAMYKYTYDKT